MERVLIASDIHCCHIDWYGVKNLDRMNLFVKHVEEEYKKEPFSALLLLGDYSLDHWIGKGSYLEKGICNTKMFCDVVVKKLKEIGVPILMCAGNHEQYGHKKWKEITGFERYGYLKINNTLYIVLDTYGDNLDPKEHGDGTYKVSDVNYIKDVMAKNPDCNVVLCSHYFDKEKESEEFKKLVCENERILCLVCGHVHMSDVIYLGEEWGNKVLLYTGNYSYNSGEEKDVKNSMWGFRDIKVDENELVSRYITPQNHVVLEGEKYSHPYSYQDEYKANF